MIVPAQAVRVVVATQPIDFRRGHDSLAACAQNELKLDPHSGVLIVFRSRRGDRVS
jgi:transposase